MRAGNSPTYILPTPSYTFEPAGRLETSSIVRRNMRVSRCRPAICCRVWPICCCAPMAWLSISRNN